MTAVLRALLVDDERLARKRLRDLLARHPEIEIVGEEDCLETAETAAEALKPDVLFLDVELSPGNGFDLLPKLSFQPATVFVTAYEAFAVQAFEVLAFDYLLKPVKPERLARTVERLLASRVSNGEPASVALTDQIVLKDARVMRIVEAGQIIAITAEGAYSRVMLRGMSSMMVLRGISEWERLLPETHFAKLDRSLIVQLPLVRAIEAVSRNEAWVTIDGLSARLGVGRSASLRLRRCVPALQG